MKGLYDERKKNYNPDIDNKVKTKIQKLYAGGKVKDLKKLSAKERQYYNWFEASFEYVKEQQKLYEMQKMYKMKQKELIQKLRFHITKKGKVIEKLDKSNKAVVKRIKLKK